MMELPFVIFRCHFLNLVLVISQGYLLLDPAYAREKKQLVTYYSSRITSRIKFRHNCHKVLLSEEYQY